MNENEFGAILENIESQIQRLAESMADVPGDVRKLREDVEILKEDIKIVKPAVIDHETRLTHVETA